MRSRRAAPQATAGPHDRVSVLQVMLMRGHACMRRHQQHELISAGNREP